MIAYLIDINITFGKYCWQTI